MEIKGKTNPQEIQIQGLLDRYLRLRTSNSDPTTSHLDEDSLSAFTEGALNEYEARPIISHLVECSFCRNVTAELFRLEADFADQQTQSVVSHSEPSKISEVLNNLMSRIFGTNDGAVFAHQEKEEKSEEAEKKNDEEQ